MQKASKGLRRKVEGEYPLGLYRGIERARGTFQGASYKVAWHSRGEGQNEDIM